MINLLKYFEDNEIKVWEEDGKIKFSGPKNKINDDMISLLKDNKEKLLDYFKTQKDNKSVLKAANNQLALWLERKMGSTSGIIHNGMIKKLVGDIEIDHIKQAFFQVIKRHEALRSTFYEENHEVFIRLSDADDKFFRYEDIGICDENMARQYVKTKMNDTLNLVEGPLFRVGVYRYNENSYLLGIWGHHIISDAYSLFIIEEEFYKLYDEVKNKTKHQLKGVSLYFDTIREENAYLESEKYSNALEFNRANLDLNLTGSSLPKLQIMNDEENKYKLGTYTDTYSSTLTNEIKTYARQNNVTAFMLVFSIFNLAINFYNEGKKTSLGIFAANRTTEEHLNQVGYFSNALIFQKDVKEQGTLLEYIKEVKEQVMQLLSHQQLPFTCLVSEMNPLREGGKPFFDVVFDSLLFPKNQEVQELQNKLNIIDLELVKGSTDYDLIVWISEENKEYSLEYRYNSQLFEAYQIEVLAETVRGILDGIVEKQYLSLDKIPLVYKKTNDIMKQMNDTYVKYEDKFIFEAIKGQCKNKGDNVAISFKKQAISYNEMENLIEYVGWNLREKGVKKGDYVGILLKKSCYLIPSIIGIWAIGAVYVPIDPYFPENRKKYIINNTNLKAIIKDSDSDLFEKNVLTIEADELIHLWEESNRCILKDNKMVYEAVTADDPAYVLYTSGSTGNPKGVTISHASFVNLLYDMGNRISLTEQDKVLSIASICFDMSILEMFLSLIKGAGVVMVSYEDSKSGRKFLETILENKATVMQATPSSFEMLFDYYEKEQIQEPILKICLCGGEGYELDLVNKLQKMAQRVFNMYGPTETTVWSTFYEIPKECKKLMIGKPIANTVIRIADKKGRTLPIGVPGEILIGGLGVFKGYFNNETLTSQFLVKLEDGEFYYKTGDWAYLNQDGELKFLGRRDNQIKIRGFRVEISEIENVFRKFEGISNTAVVTVQENGNCILVAVVTEKLDIKINVKKLNAFISEYLPSYMLPSHIFILDQLPMTNTNKIDKRVIEEIVKEKLLNHITHEKLEENELEKRIREIWELILNKRIRSIHEGFFESGGNSLLLNKLVLELEKHFEKKIDIIDLLRFSSISKMALYISDKNVKSDVAEEKAQEMALRRKQFLGKRKR